MRRRSMFSVLIILLAAFAAQAQSASTPDAPTQTRPRMVTVAPSPAATPAPNTPQPAGDVLPQPSQSPSAVLPNVNNSAATPGRLLSVEKIRARIIEAERLLKSRPVPTALTVPVLPNTVMKSPGTTSHASTFSVPSIDFVTLGVLDPSDSRIHFLTLSKTLFLEKGREANLTTSEGSIVKLRVLRANGVNTAVTIFDAAGRSLAPLVVQYPIERGGRFLEMAYYTSAHPALISPDLVRAGQSYVRTMIDLAAKRLQLKGIRISPEILNVAERLCVVEHTDHDRYRRENRIALYEEIFALFALNELDTYRYAVSWAGAGGMVQMIPATYRMVRAAHPGVGLNPDFVAGMRNHGNALEAMLLYMQDTWNDLLRSEDVLYALSAKLATQTELLAAGYNSNPARLPRYIRRGGADWRTLIPGETQLYLQIYRSLESLIPMKART